MSTQQETGIEFSLVPEENQQHFRLLELPPELLSVITADNASPLQLKSLDAPPSSLSGPNVVLCTHDKTYNLRQVSTSNSVFVVQPTIPTDSTLSTPGIEAIAQCTSTLELLTEKTNVSATSLVKAALPTYTSTGIPATGTRIAKQHLFSNIPLSEAECELAWRDLACFEHEGAAMVPSDSVRLQVWRAILTTATAEGVDLTDTLDDRQVRALTENDAEWPGELADAVLRSAGQGDGGSLLLLDGHKLALSVGLVLLKERTANGRNAVALDRFEKEWADLMPEAWREKATIERLEGSFGREKAGKDITFVDTGGSQATTVDGGAPADAKTLGAKRKWHEKFKASKKTA